jgi:hypothetical protein
MKKRPNQAMAYFVLSGTFIFTAGYLEYLSRALEGTQLGWLSLALLSFKTCVEIGASFYACAFIFGSVFYLLMNEKRTSRAELVTRLPVGIIYYLCCDDLERSFNVTEQFTWSFMMIQKPAVRA